jgi:Fic family protein
MGSGEKRTGRYVQQLEGYRAFEPAPLPPEPPLRLDDLQRLLSAADLALGRLDGVTRYLPDVELFVGMYVRREALLSSQIEGSECTLDDLLAFELDGADVPQLDVSEVVNYVAALNRGLAMLGELPLCNRVLRDVHAVLLRAGRGADKTPGEFRRTQNWIGPPGATLTSAAFVPPPPHLIELAMGELERFLHDRDLPVLVTAGLAHAQFETIHPFLDGNGRIGRLFVTLLLCERNVLAQPVLYLSTFLKRHRYQYFERLMAVRDNGEWEAWLKFFLEGVLETATEATTTAQRIHELRQADRRRVSEDGGGAHELDLLDRLFAQPLVNGGWVSSRLDVSPTTANKVLDRLTAAGVLREVTGRKRNRVWRYDSYVALFDEPATPVEQDATLSV